MSNSNLLKEAHGYGMGHYLSESFPAYLQGSYSFLILLPYCLASPATTSARFGFPTSKGWGGPLTFF